MEWKEDRTERPWNGRTERALKVGGRERSCKGRRTEKNCMEQKEAKRAWKVRDREGLHRMYMLIRKGYSEEI
jgi:hypothetical protein